MWNMINETIIVNDNGNIELSNSFVVDDFRVEVVKIWVFDVG